MKKYVDYHYDFLGWIIFDLIIPWFILIMDILSIIYSIKTHHTVYAVSILLIIPIIMISLTGVYKLSIIVISYGLWYTLIAKDGIYGKTFVQYLFFFLKPKLLINWANISTIEFNTSKYDKHMGYIKIHGKDGVKIIIPFNGILPYNNNSSNNPDEEKESGLFRGINLEMMGLIAWIAGLDKLVGFPETNNNKNMKKFDKSLTIENIKRVVELIEKGEYPFKNQHP